MKRKILALILAAALFALSGCSVSTEEMQQKLEDFLSFLPGQETSSVGESLGSAGLLEGECAVVAVFIDGSDEGWSAQDLARAQRYLRTGLDFIEKQAARYEKQVHFSYTESDAALNFHQSYTGTVAGEADFSALYQEIVDWLGECVPAESLKETYAAQNISYMVLLPCSGTSFTFPHLSDESNAAPEEEISFVFYYLDEERTQRQCPNTYAHELLHQFGAIDLYQGSTQLPEESALPAHVAETYPDEVMSNSTEGHTYQQEQIEVGYEISPLSAYCLGWVESVAEQELYPELSRTRQGALYSSECYDGVTSLPTSD